MLASALAPPAAPPLEGLVLRARFGEARLYENQRALPRAWVQPLDVEPGQEAVAVPIEVWQFDRIVLVAE